MDIFTKNKPFDRNERFSNEIMKVLNDIFIRELELSSLGFITIKNVSLTKETYATLDKLSKVLLPDAKLSISKTIESIANEKAKKLNGKIDKK